MPPTIPKKIVDNRTVSVSVLVPVSASKPKSVLVSVSEISYRSIRRIKQSTLERRSRCYLYAM